MKVRRPTDIFAATGADGRRYFISVITEYMLVPRPNGGHDEVEIAKHFRTTDRLVVRRVKPGEYVVAKTGLVLRSNAPNAP